MGNWAAPATALKIDFQDHINILGVIFKATITQSIKDSWAGVICSVLAQAQTAYARNLCLAQRLQYVQLCLLAKVWYVAQTFPLPNNYAGNSRVFVPGSYGNVQPLGSR